MNPLGSSQDKYTKPESQEITTRGRQDSQYREARSNNRTYIYSPPKDYRDKKKRIEKQFPKQSQSGSRYSPEVSTKRSFYPADRKQGSSSHNYNAGMSDAAQIGKRHFDNYNHDGTQIEQPKKQRVINQNECIAINRKITGARDVSEIIEICDRDIDQFNAVNIATACNRLAKMQRGRISSKVDDTLKRLADKAKENISDFKARELSNIAWAFATLGIEGRALFRELATEAKRKIQDFKPQELSNTTWAFAKLGIEDRKLFIELATEAKHKIRDFDPQGISNTAWAFAKIGIEERELFEKLAKEAKHNIRDFNAQNLSNTAWAFARLGIENKELFRKLAIEAQQKIRDFNAQDLSNTAWAFATLGIEHEKLFRELAIEANHKIRDFDAQELSNTAWAFAKLGIEERELFEKLAIEAKQIILDFNAQDLSNTAWAFAILGLGTFDFFKNIAENIRQIKHVQWTNEALTQLGQVALYLKHELRCESFSWPGVLPSLIRDAKRELKDIHSSNLHLDCSRILTLLGHPIMDEYSVNGLFVDIYIEEMHLLIEVDGPSHFASNTRTALGQTLFKARLLKAMGYSVLNIPYWEWDALKDDQAKTNYLEERLTSFKEPQTF